MTNKSQTAKERSKKNAQDELNLLIQSAQRRPGVREVMEVYQPYQEIERVANSYAQLMMRIGHVVSLSDGSQSNVSKE